MSTRKMLSCSWFARRPRATVTLGGQGCFSCCHFFTSWLHFDSRQTARLAIAHPQYDSLSPWTVRLSSCQVVRMPGCQVVRLSGCQVVCWEHLSKPPLGEEERLLDPPPQGRALPISLPMMVEGRRVPGLAGHHHDAQVALQPGLHGSTAPPPTEQQSWERWLLAVVVAASAADQGFPPPPPHRRAHWSRSHPRLVPANIRPHTDFIFTQTFQKDSLWRKYSKKYSHGQSFQFYQIFHR